MRSALSRFAAQVPDWNKRPLSYSDFERECDQRGIIIRKIPMKRVRGCSFSDDREAFIYINSLLGDPERTVTAWHELAHVLLHPVDVNVLLDLGPGTNREKWEREAELIGLCAVFPGADRIDYEVAKRLLP